MNSFGLSFSLFFSQGFFFLFLSLFFYSTQQLQFMYLQTIASIPMIFNGPLSIGLASPSLMGRSCKRICSLQHCPVLSSGFRIYLLAPQLCLTKNNLQIPKDDQLRLSWTNFGLRFHYKDVARLPKNDLQVIKLKPKNHLLGTWHNLRPDLITFS